VPTHIYTYDLLSLLVYLLNFPTFSDDSYIVWTKFHHHWYNLVLALETF